MRSDNTFIGQGLLAILAGLSTLTFHCTKQGSHRAPHLLSLSLLLLLLLLVKGACWLWWCCRLLWLLWLLLLLLLLLEEELLLVLGSGLGLAGQTLCLGNRCLLWGGWSLWLLGLR